MVDIAKKGVQRAGYLQVYAGHDTGAEATIHAMYNLLQQDETEAVLLVDAESTFNFVNRKEKVHDISITLSILSAFVSNCCLVPVRLFILANKEIKSKEETTQCDTTAMVAYALEVTPFILVLARACFNE